MITSCAVLNKGKKTGDQTEKQAPLVTAPIKAVEEKLVPIDEVPPTAHSYFVIIGSFRVPENARTFQEQIKKDGFASEILKNEEGLYRVSVLATDNITSARQNIIRIRSNFPEYYDTWLLIQKK